MPSTNRDKEKLITQEYLKTILKYNPETGDFKWVKLNKFASRIQIGDIAGCLTNNGYISIQINGKLYPAHRLAWLYMTGSWPEFDIDHIEGINIPFFNKFSNLRDTNRNNWNRVDNKNNTSGFRGVSFHKPTGKWRARIKVNGINKHLGYFNTPEEASAAYEAAKLIYHQINSDK